MKRNVFLIIIVLAMASTSFAQKPTAESISKRLSLGFGVFNDFWMKVPDSINTRAINQGVDVFVRYMFPMDKKGHLDFFIGGGIGAHNFYSEALLGVGKYNVYNTLPAGVGANESYFYNVPSTSNGKSITVKKSKLSITYIDIPFGFQYKASNKVHGTLGFKVGWSLNAHTKYKGSDLEGSGYQVKEKSNTLRNIENFHYGPYAVIGYKWFGVSAFYQLSSVFQKDLGPQIYPISVGLVFTPF
ncbi:MAG: outer membrane beta-barrel protein [Bacteroidota bacterium]